MFWSYISLICPFILVPKRGGGGSCLCGDRVLFSFEKYLDNQGCRRQNGSEAESLISSNIVSDFPNTLLLVFVNSQFFIFEKHVFIHVVFKPWKTPVLSSRINAGFYLRNTQGLLKFISGLYSSRGSMSILSCELKMLVLQCHDQSLLKLLITSSFPPRAVCWQSFRLLSVISSSKRIPFGRVADVVVDHCS